MKRSLRWLCALSFAFALALPSGSATARDRTVQKPKEGTPEYTLLQGFELLVKKDFDTWIEKWCHKGDLCHGPEALKSLRKYNLPAAARNVGECIKGKDRDTLVVTRVDGDPEKDEQIKVHVQCNEKGSPRSYYLKKEERIWKFKNIY